MVLCARRLVSRSGQRCRGCAPNTVRLATPRTMFGRPRVNVLQFIDVALVLQLGRRFLRGRRCGGVAAAASVVAAPPLPLVGPQLLPLLGPLFAIVLLDVLFDGGCRCCRGQCTTPFLLVLATPRRFVATPSLLPIPEPEQAIVRVRIAGKLRCRLSRGKLRCIVDDGWAAEEKVLAAPFLLAGRPTLGPMQHVVLAVVWSGSRCLHGVAAD
mmetsp:Transcript_27146/g.72023  ORF Transcript_27146/g.72023 Transcript_27146/m.72023 type:complete len:212 (-) Transcript_27146:1970-2605(-)